MRASAKKKAAPQKTGEPTREQLLALMKARGACRSSVLWVRSRSRVKRARHLWNTCDEPSWLTWLFFQAIETVTRGRSVASQDAFLLFNRAEDLRWSATHPRTSKAQDIRAILSWPLVAKALRRYKVAQ